MEDKKSKKTPRSERSPLIERVNRDAAGIDCGAAMHYVAVPLDRDSEPVRRLKTFTNDLERLADWLAQCGIKTAAMEATGVYWIQGLQELHSVGLLRGSFRPEAEIVAMRSYLRGRAWARSRSARLPMGCL